MSRKIIRVFNQPAGLNPLDEEKVLTRPHPRIEGALKVTGQAPYAYEHRELDRPAYGVVVGAGIARGRVKSVDRTAAEGMPGVLLILTHEDMPPQGRSKSAVPQQMGATPQMASDAVEHYGQAVAFVAAETFEQARAAAQALVIDYENGTAAADFVLAGAWNRLKRLAWTPKPATRR